MEANPHDTSDEGLIFFLLPIGVLSRYFSYRSQHGACCVTRSKKGVGRRCAGFTVGSEGSALLAARGGRGGGDCGLVRCAAFVARRVTYSKLMR